MLVCYELSGPILSFLLKPLISLMPDGSNVIATGLAETFLIHVKISLWAGLIVSSPFWLYQIWAFVAPGLYQGERRAIGRLTAMTVGLLLGGAAFAYYVVLPLGFKFFLSFGGGEITILPVVHEYLSLVMTLLLSFGLSFELPLLLVFLASVGIVDSRKLGRFRPYSVVIIVTLAAFLTPPDVVSQILMSIPMLFLYELSVFLIRRRERAMGYEPGGEGGGGGGEPGEGDPRAKARRLRLEAKEAKKKAKEEKKRSAAEAKEAKKKAAAEAKEAKKKAEEAKPQERPEAKGPGPEGKGRDGQANEP
jgi:sec-independent protein translocase protein TatC